MLRGLSTQAPAAEGHDEEKKQGAAKNVLQLIAEFYQVNHANLNKHTIIILEALMETKELSFAELRDFRIIDKTY